MHARAVQRAERLKLRSNSFAERTASSTINSSVERAKPLRPGTVRMASKGEMIRHRPRRPSGASGRIGPVRHGGTTATCPWSRTSASCPRGGEFAHSADGACAQRHRGFRADRDRGSSVSPAHPMATLSADMLLLELSSNLHRGGCAQADPQGRVGRVRVGGDPARQVRQLPPHGAVARPMAVARPGRGGGDPVGPPGTPGTALSAALRHALERNAAMSSTDLPSSGGRRSDSSSACSASWGLCPSVTTPSPRSIE